jgi:hypothetical protein
MPMSFLFYPQHEHNCLHVNHCPHLGGAALGTLVRIASENEASRWALHRTLDAERERNERLTAENEQLRTELAQVRLELKLERQNKFATNQQKQAVEPTIDKPFSSPKCHWALKRYQCRALETIPVETKGLLFSIGVFLIEETEHREDDGQSTEYGQVLVDQDIA